MGKSVHNDVLDSALNYIKTNAGTMVACSAEPTDVTQATATYKLADVVMSSTDYAVADSTGTGGGRKLTVGSKTGITIDSSGTASHVALVKSTTATALLYVTTCSPLALASGQTMTFGTWTITLRDPT